MNYDSVTINLKTENNNLSWYTIEQNITKEGKVIKQASGSNLFAIITLRIEPYPVKEVAVFEDKIAKINFCYNKILHPLQEKK